MTTADLAKIEALISALSHAGFATAADQLKEAVYQTNYHTGPEMFGEIAVAIRSAMHLVGSSPSNEVASALTAAKKEVCKVVPDCGL